MGHAWVGREGHFETEFLEALLRLAVKLLSTSASGRKALKAGNGGEGFRRLLEKYLLPLKEKDSMAEFRENMFENSEVQRVLMELKEPLNRQFLAIAKRKTKVLDPKKKPKGDGKKPEAVEEPLLTVEEYSNTVESVEHFRTHEGPGLRDRLVALSTDPSIPNWLEEWWDNGAYLGMFLHTQLHPHTHPHTLAAPREAPVARSPPEASLCSAGAALPPGERATVPPPRQ